jgi:hypothetical protein
MTHQSRFLSVLRVHCFALIFRLRAPESEAFGYIRGTVLRSKSIQAIVGEVSDIKPDTMGT